jgi:phenylpropionate dioxygenase-like ring-hydroxylating dioxygenase large terminal subunit
MERGNWLPAAWSEEVAGWLPTPIRMFGESFVAFRAQDGVPRLLDTARRSYPALDAGGLLWTYLGPPEAEPAPPDFEWMALPRDRIAHLKYEHTMHYVVLHSVDGEPLDESALRRRLHLEPGVDLDAAFRPRGS